MIKVNHQASMQEADRHKAKFNSGQKDLVMIHACWITAMTVSLNAANNFISK